MLFNFYILEDSLSEFEDKINVCFYHSFYIYLKNYYKNLCDFKIFLEFKDTKDYFTSIKDFIYNYSLLYNHLIKIHPDIKQLLNELVLGISILKDNHIVYIDNFIKLNDILDNKIVFTKNIKNYKPIILLNENEHFLPIILK